MKPEPPTSRMRCGVTSVVDLLLEERECAGPRAARGFGVERRRSVVHECVPRAGIDLDLRLLARGAHRETEIVHLVLWNPVVELAEMRKHRRLERDQPSRVCDRNTVEHHNSAQPWLDHGKFEG